MTIKEFAQLCACSTQTLRYYDRIDLLKPMKVDSWSGYRYYEARQAVDFVKIKNLHTTDPEPDFEDYAVIFERQGWTHVREFFDDIPQLHEGKTYCLWVRTCNEDFSDDLSFAMFLMGAVLYRQNLQNVTVNCSASTAKDQENHFKLLLHT